MHNPLSAEKFNEEVANLLKRKIKNSIRKLDELSIRFDCDSEVAATETSEILDKVRTLHDRFVQSAKVTRNEERQLALELFAVNLEKAFYGFEPDFFQQN